MLQQLLSWVKGLWPRKNRKAKEVVPFPSDQVTKPNKNPAHQYLYNSLKRQGFEVWEQWPSGSISFDLYLPRHRLAIYCPSFDLPATTRKVKQNHLQRIAKQMGVRFVVVNPNQFYKGFKNILIKAKQTEIN